MGGDWTFEIHVVEATLPSQNRDQKPVFATVSVHGQPEWKTSARDKQPPSNYVFWNEIHKLYVHSFP